MNYNEPKTKMILGLKLEAIDKDTGKKVEDFQVVRIWDLFYGIGGGDMTTKDHIFELHVVPCVDHINIENK